MHISIAFTLAGKNSRSKFMIISLKYWKSIISILSEFHLPAIATRLLVDNALYSFLIQLLSFLCIAVYLSKTKKA